MTTFNVGDKVRYRGLGHGCTYTVTRTYRKRGVDFLNFDGYGGNYYAAHCYRLVTPAAAPVDDWGPGACRAWASRQPDVTVTIPYDVAKYYAYWGRMTDREVSELGDEESLVLPWHATNAPRSSSYFMALAHACAAAIS